MLSTGTSTFMSMASSELEEMLNLNSEKLNWFNLGNYQWDIYNDVTLPIINEPKHPRKGEYKEQNGRTHIQEDKRTN
jgi:hypothetical protein